MADVINPQPLTRDGRSVAATPITPHHARRGQFMPQVGGQISIGLPGETVRGVVEEVYGPDVLLARITGIVMGKTGHAYKTNDMIALHRVSTDISERWEPVSDREVREQEERERAQRAALAAAPQPVVAPPAPVVAAPAPDIADTASFPPRPDTEPAPEPEPEHKRVLGPRRTKIARA